MLKYVVWTFLFVFIQFIFIECIGPPITPLRVRKFDSNLVMQKRQDTMDLCRIFESERQKHPESLETLKRKKREILGATLQERDQMLESIIDKMYDELDGDKPGDKSGRRFPFAPAIMEGPGPNKGPSKSVDPEGIKTVPVEWPKKWKHGIVPYYIDSKTYDSGLAEKIMNAFDYFERNTCIRLQRLREQPSDELSMSKVQWIYISNPLGIKQCVHSNEKLLHKGVQMVVFGYDCMSTGEIVHEMMHVLGFSHEHTRADRDMHISVKWDNIKPGYKKYFELRPEDILSNLPYDYESILHYPTRAFSKNGQVTLATKTGQRTGQRYGLSTTDIEKVSRIFGGECMDRNKEYLVTTCPSVFDSNLNDTSEPPSAEDIKRYFKNRLWPNGIVTYKFKNASQFSTEEKLNIEAVIKHIQDETCLKFVNTDDAAENDYEEVCETDGNEAMAGEPNKITSDSSEKGESSRKSSKKRSKSSKSGTRRHATSQVVFERSPELGCPCPESGMPSTDEAVIKLNSDCFNSVNDLLHVFVHILGLDHQHNMHDRDKFIRIVWEKLAPDVKKDMEKILPREASVGFAYDYQSVMHFPWLQIKNGVTNIIYPVWTDGWAMGRWEGLSSVDVDKLELLYNEICINRVVQEIAN